MPFYCEIVKFKIEGCTQWHLKIEAEQLMVIILMKSGFESNVNSFISLVVNILQFHIFV